MLRGVQDGKLVDAEMASGEWDYKRMVNEVCKKSQDQNLDVLTELSI